MLPSPDVAETLRNSHGVSAGIANVERFAQNMRFEAMGDKKQAMLDAAERDGTRVKR